MKTFGSGSTARAFAGRFCIALLVGSLLMTAAVAGVNREVGRKLDRIPKIELTTAPLPPGGANYLLVGSDTREFVSNQLEIDAFGDAESEGGRRSDEQRGGEVVAGGVHREGQHLGHAERVLGQHADDGEQPSGKKSDE